MATTRLITADELERASLGDGRYELIDGELVEMSPTSERHSDIEAGFVARLWLHVVPRKLGRVYNADAGFVLFGNPRLVRVPDAAFVRADRLPPEAERDKFLRLAPDLVVEVVSPTDRAGKVARKVEDWLAAGVRLLWLFRPRDRTVTVYAPGRPTQVLGIGDVLDGEDVLPGFRLPLADLFRVLD